MSKFHITIIEEVDGTATTGDESIERLSMRLDTLDLHHVVQVLTTPAPVPKKPRVDAGKPRGPRRLPNHPDLL